MAGGGGGSSGGGGGSGGGGILLFAIAILGAIYMANAFTWYFSGPQWRQDLRELLHIISQTPIGGLVDDITELIRKW